MYNSPVVDAHLHVSEDGNWISDGYDASLGRLLDEMEKSAIDYGLILSFPGLSQNAFVKGVCEGSNGKLFALAGYDPSTSMSEDIYPYLDNNEIFKGVKIHPRNSNTSPLDEKLFPLYEEIIKRGMVVNFDALGHSETLPLDEIRPTAFDRLAKKFPEMKIVLSHCGVPWVMEAFFTAKSNKNLHLDCSFIIDRYKGSSIEKDLLYTSKHLDSKLIYGSDFPERSINRYYSLAKIFFSEITEEKRSNIFGGNAIKLYGLE